MLRRLLAEPDPGLPSRRDRGLQPDHVRPGPWPRGALRRDPPPGKRGQQRCPRGRGDRAWLDDLPGSFRRGPAGGDPGPREQAGKAPSTPRPGSSAPSAGSSASTAAISATRPAAGSARTARAAITAIPAAASGRRSSTSRQRSGGDEDRPGHALRLPDPGRRQRARPLPLRELPPARSRRPDHQQQPRPPAGVRGRRDPPRQGLQHADQWLGRHDHGFAPLCQPDRPDARAGAIRRAPLPRAVRALPVADPAPPVAQREHRHLPRLCRILAVVRVRPAVHAGPRVRGCTAGSRSAPPPGTSSTATSRATTRSSPTAWTWPASNGRCPCRAGRTAPRTCSSSAATSRARASSSCSRRTGSCAARASRAGS